MHYKSLGILITIFSTSLITNPITQGFSQNSAKPFEANLIARGGHEGGGNHGSRGNFRSGGQRDKRQEHGRHYENRDHHRGDWDRHHDNWYGYPGGIIEPIVPSYSVEYPVDQDFNYDSSDYNDQEIDPGSVYQIDE